MKKWIKQYHVDRANEQAALSEAKRDSIGVNFKSGGVGYIAWPNGEISEAEEYTRWLAHRAIVAQYGEHG